ILGYPAERWLEAGFWASITEPEDLHAMPDDMGTVDGNDTYRGEYRMRAADGRVGWFHDEAHLIRGIDGTPVSWQGVMVDVTTRREAEQELRLARERLEALIEHIPAIVYRESDDEDPAKFFVSPQVERILGYTREQWTWTDDFWVDRLHPDD